MSHGTNREIKSTTVDLEAIAEKWLRRCGACDAGLQTACTHPLTDYRPVIKDLVDEVERLRAELLVEKTDLIAAWTQLDRVAADHSCCRRHQPQLNRTRSQRLSDAAAIYRSQGDRVPALKLEAVLSRLDNNRPVRVVDLEAAESLANAILEENA